jgi:hypothetical protein
MKKVHYTSDNSHRTAHILLPLAFTSGLAGLALLGPVRHNPKTLSAFAGAAFALLIWNALIFIRVRHKRRPLGVEIVLKKQDYLQACGQAVILMYWGWYRPQL